MSVAPVHAAASALTQLQQVKLSAALAAKHRLLVHPAGQQPAANRPAAATETTKLPQDTVTLSAKAQKAAAPTDVDHDGDAH